MKLWDVYFKIICNKIVIRILYFQFQFTGEAPDLMLIPIIEATLILLSFIRQKTNTFLKTSQSIIIITRWLLFC